MQRRLMLSLALAAPLALSPLVAAAQPWPTQPVKIVVPAPAGSSLDIIVRLMGDKLKDRWGQPVVVENKPGAGGMLGTDVAAKAAPDGHTMVLAFNGPISFAPFMYAKMPYDPQKDLRPVVMTTSQPNVLAVGAGVPATNVKEFVAWAKAKPGGMNFSSLGKGSSSHLSMELFLAEAGVAGTHVPYNGSPPSAMAVAQGEVDATMMVAPAMLPHVQSGRVKLLAVTSRQRPESLANLPTMADAGYPSVEALAWNGLFVPAATPTPVVDKINADVNAVLRDADVRAKLDNAGMTPVGGSAAEFAAAVSADTQRWGPIIGKIGLKID